MSDLVLCFSISLDGFVAGPEVSAGQPMGAGGERLHDWMFKSEDGADAEMAREQMARPGAIVLGKRTFDVGLEPWGDTPYPAPCFVLTHEKRAPLKMKGGTFTFVNDGIESAVRQAKAVAGGKDVIVMGGKTAQQCLKAGLVDEIVLQLVPVLMGRGNAAVREYRNRTRRIRRDPGPANAACHASGIPRGGQGQRRLRDIACR
jgi:dihydrofolate reductase